MSREDCSNTSICQWDYTGRGLDYQVDISYCPQGLLERISELFSVTGIKELMPVEMLQWELQEPLIAQEVEWVEKESPEVKQKAAKKSTTTQVFWREIQTEMEHQRPLPTLI